ncbi:hypothetical protein OG765_21325 [Streptomyces sp. NBC_00555]|uniref:hypothetical protein n=1 Tax=Streptomyces sp. NBC_00555 TaxID=2903662 RepID=UPI00225AA322|nr:hypothetical protein [Streptomyces sp. NBC_00555]MCX5013514.1 hypothetical protein [Streptomyces sp. NBC_00555]
MANIPSAFRTPENRLRCNGADAIVRILDREEIRVLPLSPSTAVDEVDRVLRQLREYDAAANERAGRTAEPSDSAHKHAGEAHSIVNALRTVARGGTTLLLSNDGGAMKVAELNGIPYKHVGNLIAELACVDPAPTAEELLQHFNDVTAHFATVPQRSRPTGTDFFSCHMTDGVCGSCDRM